MGRPPGRHQRPADPAARAYWVEAALWLLVELLVVATAVLQIADR